MTSPADLYMVEKATAAQSNEPLLSEKRMIYITDTNSNGGNFGQELQFNLNNLSSQTDYTNLEDYLVHIPHYDYIKSNDAVFSASAVVGVSNTINKDLLIFKNGSHHDIKSASLTIDGKVLQDHQDYLNMSVQADMMTTFSQEEMAKYGSTLLMSKTPEDYTDFEAATESTVFTAAGVNICDASKNASALERKLMQNNSASGLTAATVIGNQVNQGKSLVQTKTTAANTVMSVSTGEIIYVKYTPIIVRLKDICPVVKSLPPLKNIKGTLYIKLNSISANFTTAASLGAPITITNITNTAGNYCPVQFLGTSGVNNLLSAGTATAVGNFTLFSGPLGQNPATVYPFTIPTPPSVNARLIGPKLVANPSVDAALSMKKTFTYLERKVNSFALPQKSGNTFNVNSSLANPRFLRCIPFFSGKGAATMTNFPTTINPFLSLTSSEGATSSPLAQLTNFNVYVNNKPAFQDANSFEWENFLYEVAQLGENAGKDSQMGSGLLNSYLWEHFYRYYCCDISRRLPSEDGNMKGIQMQAYNATNLPMILVCETFNERKLTIDTALCQWVSASA